MKKILTILILLAGSIQLFGQETEAVRLEIQAVDIPDVMNLSSGSDGGQAEARVRQPSFVENGGQINRNEHAWLIYVDGALYPPPVMVGYRYGLFFWWDIGFDVGGNDGIFQALIHTRMENFKTKNELFFWALEYKTGYKYHRRYFTDTLAFDDESWILILENSFGFRLGERRNNVVYLNTQAYFDFDLRTPRRQMDFYLSPATLGYEIMINNTLNFFLEAGVGYSPTGTETDWGMMFVDDWFPVAGIGMAFRTGDRTAVYGKKPK